MDSHRKHADRFDVDDDAKVLALDYLYYRLRKIDFAWDRCPLLPDPQRPALILRELGDEFEKRYGDYFGDLSSTLSITSMTSYEDFSIVCKELFRGNDYYKVDGDEEVKWSRIVALFAFGGMLAVECARNNLADRLINIANWISIYVRNRLSFWICKHGGWDGLTEFYEIRAMNQRWDRYKGTIAGAVVGLCGVLALAAIIRRHV